MVAHDQQGRVAVDSCHGLTDELVHPDVHVADRMRVRVRAAAERGVIGVEEPPEHVLDPVRAVEDTDDHAAPHSIECIEEHRLALPVDRVRLVEKRVLGHQPLGKRPGILGQAQRGERALLAGKVGRIDRRMGDRHGRLVGIDLQRRAVHLERGARAASNRTGRSRGA